jgi:hypothetical protein
MLNASSLPKENAEMRKIKNSPKSFTVIEVFVIVILVVVLGLIAVLIYHHEHPSSAQSSSQSCPAGDTPQYSTIPNNDKTPFLCLKPGQLPVAD